MTLGRVYFILGSLLCGLISLPSQGISSTVTLDQQSYPANTGTNGVRSDYRFAQTFTAGLDGRLSAIEVWLEWASSATSTDITLTLSSVDGNGAPDELSALGSISVPVSNLPQTTGSMFRFELDSLAVLVTVGDKLAFILGTSAGYCCSFRMGHSNSPADAYSGGLVWRGGNPGWVDNGASASPRWNEDMIFKTYVDTSITPVPLPAALPLLGAGLVAVGAVRWVRRKHVVPAQGGGA